MKANIKNLKENLNIKHRKDQHFYGAYLVTNKEGKVIIDVRFYIKDTQ